MDPAIDFLKNCMLQAKLRHGIMPVELAVTPRAVVAMTTKFKTPLPPEVDGVKIRCLGADEADFKELPKGHRVLLVVVDNGVWHNLQLVDVD